MTYPIENESEPPKREVTAGHELHSAELAQLAATIFIKASGEYPAAAIAQAVRVQQLVRQHQSSAQFLGTLLESSLTELEHVTQIANNAHRHAAKTATQYEHIPEAFTVFQSLIVIQHVFLLAELFRFIPDEYLQHVLTTFYPQFLENKKMKGRTAAEKLLTHQTTEYFSFQVDIPQPLPLAVLGSSAHPPTVESTTAD